MSRAQLPFAPSATVASWLGVMAPLHPFLVWPFGLYRFAAPIVADNACLELTTRFEILDEHGFIDAAAAALGDVAARRSAQDRAAQCLAAIRQLPDALAVFNHHVDH